MNEQRYTELPFPAGGLDESGPYHQQGPSTSPSLLNVRATDPLTGRVRGAQRSGLTRAFDAQVNGSAPIQDIDAVTTNITAYPVTAGRLLMHHGNDITNIVTLYSNLEIERLLQIGLENVGHAVFDNEGSLYLAQVGNANSPYTTPLAVYKFDPQGNELWRLVLYNSTTTAIRQTLGMGINKGILYVCGTIGSTSTNVFLWRIDPRAGVCLDSGTFNSWKNTTLISWHRIGSIVNDYHRQFAVGPTRLAICCPQQDQLTTSWQILDYTGAQVATGTLKAGNYSVEDVEIDTSDNVYICYATTNTGSGQADRLVKLNSSGAVQWTISGTFMSAVSYDRTYARLLVAGSDINSSAGQTVATINVSTGASVLQTNLQTYMNWVRCDGRGGYFAGVTTASNRVTTYHLSVASGAFVNMTNSPIVLAGAEYWSAVENGFDSVQITSGSQRTTRLVTASLGTIKSFDRYGLIEVVSGSSALWAGANQIFSAQNGGILYFADGVNWKKFTPSTMTVSTWSATAGSLPTGTDTTNLPRLICTWRGRTLLSGIIDLPQNIYGSAQNDPTNFDFGPATTLVTQAFAMNDTELGKVPDLVTCMIPYSDDILIIGGDHTIWRMNGDPMDDGTLQKVSDTIGMAWGMPYCMDPIGILYFFGSRGGVYRMTPGGLPEMISQKINERLYELNVANTSIRMAWDDRQGMLHLWLTELNPKARPIHYTWDARTQGWFPDQYADYRHNPRAVYVFDGDDPDDRVVFLGGWDGYIRYLDRDSNLDDDRAIDSYVFLGPMQNPENEGVLIRELQATLDKDSDPLTWSVHVGKSEREALEAAASISGTLPAGKSRCQPCRRHGHAIYVRIGNAVKDTRWALEWLGVLQSGSGRIRRRGWK